MINEKIRLVSQRSKKIDKRSKCARCESYYDTVFSYAESNIGPVNLCYRCKEIIREKSFGKIEIHQEGLVGKFIHSGGLWEKNKRKF